MPLAGAAHKLGGCQSANAAMRTRGVVVRPPCLDDPSCCCQRWKQVLVQALVAQATIKAFDEAVLLRLARRDVMPLDPSILAPGQDGVTGQFGTIVAGHRARQPATFGDGAQFTNDPPALQRRVDDTGQAFPAVIVDDVQHAEPPAAGQCVRHEVERPALTRFSAESPSVPACRAPACGRHVCGPSAPLAIQLVDLLQVHALALRSQQERQLSVADRRRSFAQPSRTASSFPRSGSHCHADRLIATSLQARRSEKP